MTEIINHFDLPNEIKELNGSFIYRFFDPLENIEENSRFASNNEDEPRYIKLNWKNNSQIFSGLGLASSSHNLIHKENLFFPSDINSGFSALSSDEAEVSASQDFVISDNTSIGSKLEYLLETIASSAFTEAIEENLNNSELSKIPVLDVTTNRPIVQANSVDKHGQAPDMLVRNANISQIVESSVNSPLSGAAYNSLLESTKSVSRKAKSELASRANQRLLTTFFSSINKLADENELLSVSRELGSTELDDWKLVGFCIFKYRVEENKQTFLYARTVLATTFRDPYVAYGKTYRYEIRPIFCKYVDSDPNSFKTDVIFLGSDESSFIDVECLENKAPSPPKNIRFNYIANGNIEINWQRPGSYVADTSIANGILKDKMWDTDDIKGYQLFYRHSLQEPFQLYRYFTFNNTVPTSYRGKASELISDDLIISSEYEIPEPYNSGNPVKFYEFTKYNFEIRANTDYYFALCSIDAHGNSSNYSSQHKVRRDNITGEVDIQLASVEGAPKQYPNLLLSGELVEPAMKVSGYQYLDVHFAPDTLTSIPNRNEAATVLQLFELETQIEKKITITINET